MCRRALHTVHGSFLDPGCLARKQDSPLTAYADIREIPYQSGASTILTALYSASTLLIVSLRLFGLCGKVFANPLITEVIVASRNKIKGA